MGTYLRVNKNVTRIGGDHPLELIIDGKSAAFNDRSDIDNFIEDACIHTNPSECDDPLIRALHAVRREIDPGITHDI